ncbi:MAG: RagB/SusD family nutrient uptake outer membrane protein [Bacteroidales bacterium]
MNASGIYSAIILLIGAIFLDVSCDADKLKLTNPNELTPDCWFKNENQVQEAVNSAYINLQARGLYQQNIYDALDNMTYENFPNPSLVLSSRQYFCYSFDASSKAIESYWASCYLGINKANFVINNADRMNQIPERILSQSKKNKYIGETKFLRALYYFLLVTRFGDVPLITDWNSDNFGVGKSPVALIWSQIENDLNYAALNCLSKTDEEKGRVTSGAAWALLGKVHLFQANASKNQADYEAAKNAFSHVLSDPNYYLESRYLNNFEEETEHGPESIFEVEFNPKLGYNDRWSSDRDGSGFNECTFRGQDYGCFDWFNVFPSPDLINEFEPGDPRINYCFYVPGEIKSAGDTNVVIMNAVVYNQGKDTSVIEPMIYYDNGNTLIIPRTGWRKYQNYYKQKSESSVSPQASGINMKVIRYADVLLMMAEVENESGNSVEAINYLNRVRDRVLMPDYNTPEMDTKYPVTNMDEIRIAIEHERKVELCGEQVRFDDLVRWRRLEQFITGVPKLPWIEYSFQFDANKHYLWPIPQAEIDINPALTQADQNPGY